METLRIIAIASLPVIRVLEQAHGPQCPYRIAESTAERVCRNERMRTSNSTSPVASRGLKLIRFAIWDVATARGRTHFGAWVVTRTGFLLAVRRQPQRAGRLRDVLLPAYQALT
jgi:hypothetical protein